MIWQLAGKIWPRQGSARRFRTTTTTNDDDDDDLDDDVFRAMESYGDDDAESQQLLCLEMDEFQHVCDADCPLLTDGQCPNIVRVLASRPCKSGGRASLGETRIPCKRKH
jgi:hypothetical protein